MDLFLDFLTRFATQFQSPTLAFLIGGMLLAAFGSKLQIPNAIYQFAVFMLLLRIGISGGIEIRQAELSALLIPALMSILLGLIIVAAGRTVLAVLPGVRSDDAIATAGLFGAVSASTLAAAMVVMDEEGLSYEAWAPALYPFMDIPALLLAIILANLHQARQSDGTATKVKLWPIIRDSLQGAALSALLLGLALGLLTRPERVFESFYDPLFRGLLSVLMLIMGMEAYQRLGELRRVAHWYAVYAFVAPITHGVLGFGLGYLAHLTVGFSAGGTVILAVLAASSSDISGPPTLRAAIPTANPSSYLGASTSIGTPVAIAVCIPLFVAMAGVMF
ncbi:MAG: sodium-dependent bicarbonate transport family permease [Rhodobacteraceae bacterium]|nr:sodium-dependent bicarbonate transport family permease [Paracoccaceae bacterium]